MTEKSCESGFPSMMKPNRGSPEFLVEAEGTEHSFLDSVQRREYERKRAKLLANPREINEKTDLLLPFQEKSVTGAPMEALRYTLKEPVVVMELKYSDGRSVMMSKESFAILRDLESDRSVFGDLVENKAIFLEAKPRTLHPGMRVVMGAVQVRGSLAELWPSTQHTPIMQYLQERD